MNITDFLLARIAEDQAAAYEASPGKWEIIGGNEYLTGACVSIGPLDGGITFHDAEHIARNAPARVLAECTAKLEIIRWWTDGLIGYAVAEDGEMTNPLLPLAAVYKDHPDYQEEWVL